MRKYFSGIMVEEPKLNFYIFNLPPPPPPRVPSSSFPTKPKLFINIIVANDLDNAA